MIRAFLPLEVLVIPAALLHSLMAILRSLPAAMAQLILVLLVARWRPMEQLRMCLVGRVTSPMG